MKCVVVLLAIVACCGVGFSQDLPADLPKISFHLTARPWKPLNVSRGDYLDAIEGVCRFTARHQDARGAVIDPFLHVEHQYSTPYFAFAVGTLLRAGRAIDLRQNGILAMDHATACFAKGDPGIPQQHGEFFLASLPGALELYRGQVSAEEMATWRQRLRTPREQIVHGPKNNWRTYAMKGEWLRAKAGLVDRASARTFIDDCWYRAEQRSRVATDKWNLYQDRNTDPDSHAVEAVGRGNLLALMEAGYDGSAAVEIGKCVERGTAATLLLQDPSGQSPPGGRTDDHVFNDVLYQLSFDVMAERAQREGDAALASQFRHAAMQSFQSIGRWRRNDGEWNGSYYITKNHFDPRERVGYQPASNYTNYNGAVMLHLAEAYLSRQTEIVERPSPVEIGGYALSTDARFASAAADAGGMQLSAALRGDTIKTFDHYWTALGVVRMGRVNWDTRLGPSDGVRDAKTGRGVTFAPTWRENGKWMRMADLPDRYQGKFSVQFVHPLLVRCAIDYAPIKGDGPSFRHEFVLTPDGVLATLRSKDAHDFGVTWPVLEDDGAPLHTRVAGRLATTAFAENADEEAFLSLDNGASPASSEQRVRSSYGWLRPVRAMAVGGVNRTFVYPRRAGDPSAEKVLMSFRVTDDGFDSELGSVHGSLYVGRTSAGGEADRIDVDGDGNADAVFEPACRFVLQLRDKKIVAVEADRKTIATIHNGRFVLQPYVPVMIAAGN